MSKSFFLFLLLAFCSTTVFANHPNISVRVDGKNYYCSENADGRITSKTLTFYQNNRGLACSSDQNLAATITADGLEQGFEKCEQIKDYVQEVRKGWIEFAGLYVEIDGKCIFLGSGKAFVEICKKGLAISGL